MAKIERFEDLEVWQTSRQLVNLIYDLSDIGDFARDFGLKDQMRRASVSIMSNIAEGFESRTQPLFIELLGRAKASAGELRAQLYIALDRKYLTDQQFSHAFALTESCTKQLSGFMHYLETQRNSGRVKEDQAYYLNI